MTLTQDLAIYAATVSTASFGLATLSFLKAGPRVKVKAYVSKHDHQTSMLFVEILNDGRGAASIALGLLAPRLNILSLLPPTPKSLHYVAKAVEWKGHDFPRPLEPGSSAIWTASLDKIEFHLGHEYGTVDSSVVEVLIGGKEKRFMVEYRPLGPFFTIGYSRRYLESNLTTRFLELTSGLRPQ